MAEKANVVLDELWLTRLRNEKLAQLHQDLEGLAISCGQLLRGKADLIEVCHR